MPRIVQIRVDLPHGEYEEAKMVAGSAANVPAFIRNAVKEAIERWTKALEREQ